MAQHRRRRKGGGRKRKDGPRTPSGRLSRAYQGEARDEGTPQLQAHKLAVVNGVADPTLNASLSGILFAHSIITARQRDAADRFRRARTAVFGVALGDRDPNRPEISDKQRVHNERRYNRMCRKLSTDHLLEVINVALDMKSPWMRRAVLGLPLVGEDELERRHLLDGLAVLAGDGPQERPGGP
jgi:hypothetical protein